MPHVKDMESFKETFYVQQAPSNQSCDVHVTSDTAVSLVDSGVIRVDGENARNGTTAGMIDTLVAGKNLVRDTRFVSD